MGQGCITNWGSFVLIQIGASVITNWGSLVITKWGTRYHKLGQLLQIRATVITNWGSCYKLRQTLLQIGAAITKCGNYYKLRHNSFHNDYVGKKDRNLIIRLSEYEKKENQPMFQHFRSCEKFNLIV